MQASRAKTIGRVIAITALLSGVLVMAILLNRPATASSQITLTLNANGDVIQLTKKNLTSPDPNTYNYQAVDEIPVNTRDFVENGVSQTTKYDLYQLIDPAETSAENLVVTVYYYVKGGWQCTAKPVLKLNGTELRGTAWVAPSGTAYWYALSQVMSRPGGGTWQWSDLTSLQAGVELYASQTRYIDCAQVYVTVTYDLVTYQPRPISVCPDSQFY